MVKLIEMMLKEGLLKKESISFLVRSRPPKKVNFANLIEHKFIDINTVEDFLAKKIRQGVITLGHLEKIEGMDVNKILQLVATELKVKFIDLDDKDLDMNLFAKTPYKQLLKYDVIPVEESELSILIVFGDPLNMEAQDVMQRIFPRKPIDVGIARPRQIHEYLQRLE
ncbi:MAG: general secretion pathway protein GspE, partial [Campylobacterales bacterium]|nr:general secretion pathway protein GspE [Campylobacterales bacterium]